MFRGEIVNKELLALLWSTLGRHRGKDWRWKQEYLSMSNAYDDIRGWMVGRVFQFVKSRRKKRVRVTMVSRFNDIGFNNSLHSWGYTNRLGTDEFLKGWIIPDDLLEFMKEWFPLYERMEDVLAKKEIDNPEHNELFAEYVQLLDKYKVELKNKTYSNCLFFNEIWAQSKCNTPAREHTELLRQVFGYYVEETEPVGIAD